MSNPWATICRLATYIRDDLEGPFGGDFRSVSSDLSVILDHLVCCPADDPAAQAVRTLVDAWLAAIAAREWDETWAHLDDGPQDAGQPEAR